jgi:hypothetical protein
MMQFPTDAPEAVPRKPRLGVASFMTLLAVLAICGGCLVVWLRAPADPALQG